MARIPFTADEKRLRAIKRSINWQRKARLEGRIKPKTADQTAKEKVRQQTPEVKAKAAAKYAAKKEAMAAHPRPLACEVCEKTSKDALHWDHDHITEAFRGWLCRGCNIALGVTNDDPTILRTLADYLEFHRANA